MMYVQVDNKIVSLPTATAYCRDSDEVKFADEHGELVATFFVDDVRGIADDKLEIVARIFEDEPEEDHEPHWDGS